MGLVLFRLQGVELWAIKAKGIGGSETPSPIPFGLKETFPIPFGIMPARPYTLCSKKLSATVKLCFCEVFSSFSMTFAVKAPKTPKIYPRGRWRPFRVRSKRIFPVRLKSQGSA